MADSTLSFNVLAKDNASRTIAKVGQSFGGLHLSVGKVMKGLVAVGPALAGLAIGAGIKDFVNDARESAKVGRLTEAVIKSTGGAARITADQVGNLATAISNKTGADDEAVQSGENLLLTFTNIKNGVGKGNQIFDQATQAVTDMTAALNDGQVTTEGIKASSIQLGKALNDPIKGVTALSKVGVSFTAGQKKQIKSLVDSGKTMEAQKIILGELNKEFGGAAAAASDPLQKLGVIVGNAKETIGGAFLPVVDKVATALGKIVPVAVSKAGMGLRALGQAFKGEGVTSDGFVGVMERIGVVARAAFSVFKTDVLPRLREFGGFIANTILPKLAEFAGFVKTQFVSNVIPAVKNLVAVFQPLVVEVGTNLAGAFKKIEPPVASLGKTIASTVGPALKNFTGFLKDNATTVRAVAIGVGAIVTAVLLYKGALGVVSIATKAFAAVQAALNVVMALNPIGIVILAIVGLAAALIYAYKHSEKFRNIVNTIGGALKTAFLGVVGFVKDTITFFGALPGRVTTALGDTAKWLLKKGQDFITGLMNGIWSIAKGIDKWMMRAPVAKLLAPWYGAIKWLIPRGVEFVRGLMNGIAAVAKTIGGWLYRNVISPAVAVFGAAGGWLVRHGRSFVQGLISGVAAYMRAIGSIGGWLYSHVIVPAVSVFGKAGSWLARAGRDLIGGLVGGIATRMKGIGGWIKANVVDPMVRAVKTFFGIKSPSKVFEGIGGHLIGGLMKGMGSGMGSAIAKKVFGDMPSALRAVVGKGLVSFSSLPQKALNALGFGADFTVPGMIPGALSGPNRRVFYDGEAFDLVTYNKLAKAMKMAGSINVTQGGYERASSYSGTTHTGGGVFDVVGGNLPRILGALKASGLIGWIRNPSQGNWPWHIHALDPSDTGRMSASARGQVASYYNGGNGLGGYKQGTPWVPDDQLAYLHKGEAVIPADVNRQRMQSAKGGAQTIVLRVESGGSRMDDMLMELIKKYVRIQGGDVQKALGR